MAIAASIIAAGVIAGATVGGAAIAAKGQGDAADTQAAASEKATAAQVGATTDALDFQKQIYGQRQANCRPTAASGLAP